MTDNGPGLSADARRHLFEPLFTTKGPGGGIGLGLFTAYDIVTVGHGGTLEADDVPNGACFRVVLPRHASPPSVRLPVANALTWARAEAPN